MNPTERAERATPALSALLASLFALGCDRATPAAVPDAVVSLSPAATGLIIAMGATDRLVGVSTFDADGRVAKLPRVGDYENVDWERIRALGPRHLITQVAPDRLPAGFVDQARSIGCAIRPIHIDRLDDVRVAIEAIGAELDSADAARRTWADVRAKLDAIAAKVAGAKKPRVLLAISDDALNIVAGDTFLDDLLQIAGGTNAADGGRRGYPSIDREQLAAIDPDVVVFILPNAKADVAARARSTVASLGGRSRDVVVIPRDDALQPNANVTLTAQAIADGLHREAR